MNIEEASVEALELQNYQAKDTVDWLDATKIVETIKVVNRVQDWERAKGVSNSEITTDSFLEDFKKREEDYDVVALV